MRKFRWILCVLSIISTGWGCTKSNDLPDVDDCVPMPGGETLFAVTANNTFSNGDKVVLVQWDEVHSLSRVDETDTDFQTVAGMRSFYFDFTRQPASLDFSLELVVPQGEGWKLCCYSDGGWQELENAVYTDGLATVLLHLEFSSLSPVMRSTGCYWLAARVAFVRIGELAASIEVVKNPSGNNPFAAVAKVSSQQDIVLTMTIKGQDNNDIVHTFGGLQRNGEGLYMVPVLGLYNRCINTVWLDARNAQGTVLRRTLSIPVDVPYPAFYTMKFNTSFRSGFKNAPDELYIVVSTGWVMGGGIVNPDLNEAKNCLGFDQYGKVRWANTDCTHVTSLYPIQYNGKPHMIGNTTWTNQLYLYDYMGSLVKTYDMARDFTYTHHDAVNIAPNVMAVPTAIGTNDERCIVEVDMATGHITQTYDMYDIIDPDRPAVVAGVTDEDRTHINALVYSAVDDSYVVSARHQGVFKFRRSNHELLWWLTPHWQVGEAWRAKLLFAADPLGWSDNEWNYGQHAVSILPDGDILMYDNHNDPTFDVADFTRHSRVLSVRIDPLKLTVRKTYEWKTPARDFCVYMSNAIGLSNGNILSSWSTTHSVYEVQDGTSQIDFEAHFVPDNYRGDLYRVYKVSLYP